MDCNTLTLGAADGCACACAGNEHRETLRKKAKNGDKEKADKYRLESAAAEMP